MIIEILVPICYTLQLVATPSSTLTYQDHQDIGLVLLLMKRYISLLELFLFHQSHQIP
jgi:hypothetical protein